MPLPKIATPTYELELPSTGESIQFRPFLVKEEKVLVLALESEDTKQITTAIKAVIKSCVQTKGIKVEALPTFDIVSIDLDEIRVQKNDEHTRQIKIDDTLMMEMKYPSLDQFIKNNFDFENKNAMDQSFDLIASCVDKIYSEDEVWAADDCSKKEIKDFLEQMNSSQFKGIETFFETMPKLSHKIKVTNPNTEVESEVVLEGLASFFA